MNVTPIKTRIFKEGEGLLAFISEHVRKIPERSILVVTSKIVALSERRTEPHTNERRKIALIKRESQFAMKTKYVWLTVKDNLVMATAGIDESNGNGKLILLPRDSFATAAIVRKQIMRAHRLKRLGVIVTDSRCIPFRAGIVGVALGYAGFRGIKDYRTKRDLFGRGFHFSRVDVADSLATAAVLTMGEGSESQPLAIIQNAPVEFSDRGERHELEIDPRDDMYRPLFAKIGNFSFRTKKRRKTRG